LDHLKPGNPGASRTFRLPRSGGGHGVASGGAAAALLPRQKLGEDGPLDAGTAAHRPEDLDGPGEIHGKKRCISQRKSMNISYK